MIENDSKYKKNIEEQNYNEKINNEEKSPKQEWDARYIHDLPHSLLHTGIGITSPALLLSWWTNQQRASEPAVPGGQAGKQAVAGR